jgi:hypothetical protein
MCIKPHHAQSQSQCMLSVAVYSALHVVCMLGVLIVTAHAAQQMNDTQQLSIVQAHIYIHSFMCHHATLHVLRLYISQVRHM